MESALLRAQKAAIAAAHSNAMRAAATVLVEEGAGRIENYARTALAASAEGDMLRTQVAVLRRFLKRDVLDTIALRRAVADAVEAGVRYPFDGR
jgi:butyryl-CoA dehydrogenase